MRRSRWTLGTALAAGLLSVTGVGTPARAEDQVKAVDIANRMGGVVDDLGRKQTGTPVQGEQKAIVADLDTLIASLEKECEKCKGGMVQNNPRRGAMQSTIRMGDGNAGPLGNPDDGGKDWGKLSDRERDRILQSMTEGFPPEYRTVLERYYRRLAEEKGAKALPTKATASPKADATNP